MVLKQYIEKPAKNRIGAYVRSYFNLSTYAGSALGAGIAWTFMTTAYLLKENLANIPTMILTGTVDPYLILHSSQNALRAGSEWAAVGALGGSLAARKVRNLIKEVF